MSIVRVLVLAHLGLSAALLLVLACVMLCQRLAGPARPSAARSPLPVAAGPLVPASASVLSPYPGDEPVLVPAQAVRASEVAARRAAPAAAASVLEWTVDLSSDDRSGPAARTATRAGEPAAHEAGPRTAVQTSS